MTIYTIGHSTLSETDFLETAARGDVECIVDVRSHPVSKWPQFHQVALENWLPAAGMGYLWEPRLGGWTVSGIRYAEFMAARGVDLRAYAGAKFPKHRIGVDRTNKDREPAWTNQGLYDYSWCTMQVDFHQALQDLIWQSGHERVAIMCAESLWWKCHRSMVADVLVDRYRQEVIHLQPKITDHGKCLGNRIERYDPEIRDAWAKGGVALEERA